MEIAGDRFDQRIIDRLVLPLLGKGSRYRSFGKLLQVPGAYFVDFADWSRLAMMRNRRTLDELNKLQRDAVDPDAIGRMIALIEHEQGFPLYNAVGQLQRSLSTEPRAEFRFSGGGVEIDAEVERVDFEGWIADDLRRIEATLDEALVRAGTAPERIDCVFLTGGSSLIPSIRAIFERGFGTDRIASGGELTSIAHGLALIGEQADLVEWTA